MSEPAYLSCPACGESADQPLSAFVAKPTWQCICGFRVTLPVHEIEAMLARIDRAKRLVRFSEAE
jgi:hypothetical protein